MNITCYSEKHLKWDLEFNMIVIYHQTLEQIEWLTTLPLFFWQCLKFKSLLIHKWPLSLIISMNRYRVNSISVLSMGCLTVRGTDKTELVTITLGFFQSSWGRYHTGMLGPYGLQQSSNDIKGDWRLDLHWAVWRPVREDSSWKWKLHGILRKKSCVTALIITM